MHSCKSVRLLRPSGNFCTAVPCPLRRTAALTRPHSAYMYAAHLTTATRFQSQSIQGKPSVMWQEGELDPRYSSEGSLRKLNPDTMAHYVKATIQNDRREMGLGEVIDWQEFAQDAIYIPTRSGPLWVGSDDPRASRFMRRKEKMKRQPLQKARKKPGPDAARLLESHPLREYFTTETNLNDPLSVASNLHRAGMIREYDIKHTAAKVNYVPRPPIVSIMGHVDHGKTTLLDHLRRTNVASAEAGGITQNVGAFQVETEQGHLITFIDTPGHAAFTSMREAGASANDLIILVVSAVDGVQPQTREVVELAQRLGVPMVVAITKVDRQPQCDYIKDQLRECNVELEEEGGDVQLVKICARDGTGISDLLDALQLQAEMCEISTPTPSRAELTILESRHVGVNEVNAIVRCGRARVGQVFVAGMVYGVVKKIYDEHGAGLIEAGPSSPVTLHGFSVAPKPGATLLQVSSEAHAEKFYHFMREVFKTEGGRENYLQLLDQEQKGLFFDRKPDNNLVRTFSTKAFMVSCKAATLGMLQALLKSIYELPRLEGISMEFKVTETGGVRDYDIMTVSGNGQPACILVYGECKDTYTLDVPNHVQVIRFNVLYHGIESLKQMFVDALPKIEKTRVTATAECLQTFRASQAGRNGNAGGMMVTKGTLDAAHLTFRVIRKKKKALMATGSRAQAASASQSTGADEAEYDVVYTGQLKELRRFKDLVPTVETGLECGAILHDEFAFKKGDILEQYEVYEEARDVAAEYEAAEKRERVLRETAEMQGRMDAAAATAAQKETERAELEAQLKKMAS